MEIAIAFIAAWIIRHAVDSKRDEFHAAAKAEQRRIKAKHPDMPKEQRQHVARRSIRRKSTGWGLYQLRHGWPSLWTAVMDGWNEARRDHQEWLKANQPNLGQDNPGKDNEKRSRFKFVEAAKAGWAKAKEAAERRYANRVQAADGNQPAPQAATPIPAKQPRKQPAPQQPKQPGTADAGRNVVPIRRVPAPLPPLSNPTSNGGSSMGTAGEASGYTESLALADEYIKALNAAQAVLERYEASLLAGGLGKDQKVIGTLGTAREGVNTAAAAFQAHKQALATHQQGAEYAASKGAAAANTSWLGQS